MGYNELRRVKLFDEEEYIYNVIHNSISTQYYVSEDRRSLYMLIACNEDDFDEDSGDRLIELDEGNGCSTWVVIELDPEIIQNSIKQYIKA